MSDLKTADRRVTEDWHSRRHETREAQDAARARYDARAVGRPRQAWDALTKTWHKVTS